MDCFLVMRGTKTLALRMRAHEEAIFALRDAIARGTPESLSTAASMLDVASDPAKYNLQQMEAQWLVEHPEMLDKYMRAKAAGQGKETFYMKQISTLNEKGRIPYRGMHVRIDEL